MPLPPEHLSRLAEDLKNHERRLEELRESIRLQQDEIAVHETVLKLGQDKRLLDALNELYDTPATAKALRSNAKEHFRSKGVPFPDNADLRVVDDAPDRIALEAELQQGAYRYKVTWSRSDGFGLQSIGSARGGGSEGVRFRQPPDRRG